MIREGMNIEYRERLAREGSLNLLNALHFHHPEHAPSGTTAPALKEAFDKIERLESRVQDVNRRAQAATAELEKERGEHSVKVGFLKAQIDELNKIIERMVAAAINGDAGHGIVPTVAAIIIVVGKFYSVPVLQIKGSSNEALIVRARHVAIYLAREMTAQSFPAIGRAFGKRDHTTAIHAYQKISRQLLTDDRLADEVALLRLKLQDDSVAEAA